MVAVVCVLSRRSRDTRSEARQLCVAKASVSPSVTMAMMMTPPKNSAKANFHPSSAQNKMTMARFMFVDEIKNEKTERASAPLR